MDTVHSIAMNNSALLTLLKDKLEKILKMGERRTGQIADRADDLGCGKVQAFLAHDPSQKFQAQRNAGFQCHGTSPS